jgi:hypothetical protein
VVILHTCAAVPAEGEAHSTGFHPNLKQKGDTKMDDVMEVLGVASLVLLAITFLTGILMRHRRADLLKIHKIVGYVVFAVAICHGMLSMLD